MSELLLFLAFLGSLVLAVAIQPDTLLNLRNVFSDLRYYVFTYKNFKVAVKKYLLF